MIEKTRPDYRVAEDTIDTETLRDSVRNLYSYLVDVNVSLTNRVDTLEGLLRTLIRSVGQ